VFLAEKMSKKCFDKLVKNWNIIIKIPSGKTIVGIWWEPLFFHHFQGSAPGCPQVTFDDDDDETWVSFPSSQTVTD
jgi:hypothetical protein